MKTQVINQFDYTLGELKEPKDFDRSKTYLKVIDKTKRHFNMTYKEGINIDVVPFNDDSNDSCVKGGMYFTTLEHFPYFANYGTLVARIKIPEDAELVLDPEQNKYRTEKFEILEFIPMNKFLEQVQYIHIGTSANFNNLKTAKGMEQLETIGGYANFPDITSSEGLNNLKSIGESANFDNLKTAKGFENLKSIDGYAHFNNLTSAKGFENLKSIGGSANFRNLKTAKGFENLKSIGGYAHFNNLKSAKGLEQLKSIGRSAYFNILTTTEKQKIKALK